MVGAPPDSVAHFLAELPNHGAMTDRYLRVEELTRTGGRVAVLAPLGLRRTARTRLTARSRRGIAGTAAVGTRTRARVEWRVEPHAGGSHVALAAQMLRAGVLDNALLHLGGRWWLRRRFEAALRRLDRAVAASHEPRIHGYHRAVPLSEPCAPPLR